MIVRAQSKSRGKRDIRDHCRVLTLTAQAEEEATLLARLYVATVVEERSFYEVLRRGLDSFTVPALSRRDGGA